MSKVESTAAANIVAVLLAMVSDPSPQACLSGYARLECHDYLHSLANTYKKRSSQEVDGIQSNFQVEVFCDI
jgi:hypothetical protein